jgi:hypothetical protein
VAFLLFCLRLGGVPALQNFKYPPHPCYLLYGMFAATVLYELVDSPVSATFRGWQAFRWVSRNSLWIFFWHYAGVAALRVFAECGFPMRGWVACWVFNMGVGILFTAVQNRLLATVHKRNGAAA